MKNRKRALRRFHNARIFNHTLQFLQQWNFDDEWVIWSTRRRANNRQICSCFSCGNPRRNAWTTSNERLTMAERKANDSFHDQINEYFDVDPTEEAE